MTAFNAFAFGSAPTVGQSKEALKTTFFKICHVRARDRVLDAYSLPLFIVNRFRVLYLKKTCLILVILTAFYCSSASATDVFDPTTGYISVPSVVAGNTKYFDLIVTYKSLISGGESSKPLALSSTSPRPDTYDLEKQQLIIPSLRLGDTVYQHLVITLDQVISGPSYSEVVADSGFNGEIYPKPYFLAVGADLPGSTELQLRATLDAIIDRWGNFGPMEYWVVGIDPAATQKLETQQCDRWVSLNLQTLQECLAFQGDTQAYNLEKYRTIGAEAVANNTQSGSAGLSGRARNGFHLVQSSEPFALSGRYPEVDPSGGQLTPIHEYWHVMQHSHISNIADKANDWRKRDELLGPIWFVEGSAVYMSILAVSELQARGKLLPIGNLKYDGAKEMFWNMQNGARDKQNKFPTLEYKDISWEHNPLYYSIGSWMVAYLLDLTGKPDALLDVFHPNVQTLGFEGAFLKTFEISTDEFYRQFDEFMLKSYEEQKTILNSYILSSCQLTEYC